MVRFEMKKFIKSKRFIFLLIFPIFMSYYGFFHSSNTSLVLYKSIPHNEASFHSIKFYFPNLEAPSELSNLEDERLSAKNDLYKNELSKEEATRLEYDDNKWIMNILNENKDKYPQIFSKENSERLGNLKWDIFKYEYNTSNNSYDVYTRENINGDNFFQRMILSSKITFGIIPIIFFAYLFSDFFSKEREDDTLNFLLTQSLTKKNIIISKFIVITFSIFIYILSVILGYLVFSIISGLPLTGSNDLYRIIQLDDSLLFYRAKSLLLNLLVGFLLISMFWTNLSLFLSTRFSSNYVRSLVFIIIAFLYVLTPYINILQGNFNPIFSLDIVYRLLGEVKYIKDDIGQNIAIIISNKKLYIYLIYLISAFVLLILSFFAKNEVKISSKAKQFNKHLNLFGFESLKIFNTSSYKAYIIGSFIIIFSIFLSKIQYGIDYNAIFKEKIKLEKNFINFEIKSINQEIKKIEKTISGEKPLIVYDTNTNKRVETSHLDTADIVVLNDNLKNHNDHIQSLEGKLNTFNRFEQAYINKDSKNYYQLLKQYYSNNWDRFHYKLKNLKGDSNSIKLNSEILKYAQNNMVTPLITVTPFYSPQDSFITLDKNIETTREFNIVEVSGPILLYNFFQSKNLSFAIMLLVSIMILSGFTSDTEHGNQINLMLNTPHKREKFYDIKVLSQFTYSVIFMVLLSTIIFLLGVIIGGVKGFNFPVPIFNNTSFNLISLWRYLMRIFLGLSIFILFLTCLMNTLSVFVKKKLQLIAFTILILLIANLINPYLPAYIRILNPMTYAKIDMFADQSIIIFQKVVNASFYSGIAILLIWSTILFIIGRLLIKNKKDFI